MPATVTSLPAQTSLLSNFSVSACLCSAGPLLEQEDEEGEVNIVKQDQRPLQNGRRVRETDRNVKFLIL